MHKLESLALKQAIMEQFHKYLWQSIYDTNNNLLTYALMTAKLDTTGHHWVTGLAIYNFALNYKSGKANRDADTLSRIPWKDHHWHIEAKSLQTITSNATSSTTIVEAYSCNIQVTETLDMLATQTPCHSTTGSLQTAKILLSGKFSCSWARINWKDERSIQENALQGCYDDFRHLGLEYMLDLMISVLLAGVIMQNPILQIATGVYDSNKNLERHLWKISWPLILWSWSI